MGTERTKRKIKSIDRGCDILTYLWQNGPSTITEIQSAVDLSLGSIHTYLSTLKDNGFVQQQGTAYELGMLFVPYGMDVRNNTKLYQSSRAIIERVATEMGGCVYLISEYENRLLILGMAYGEETIQKNLQITTSGEIHRYLHCTAGGKAILAFLPEERVQAIIRDHGLDPMTSDTITDEDQLLSELETIRTRGYALNDQEHMPGIRGVGAPIIKDNEEVLGTISVSETATTWSDNQFTKEIPETIKKAANDIQVDVHSNERGIK